MTSPDAAANQALSDRLVKAALNDPLIYDPAFDSSRVFALISVLLNSPSSPKKHLIKSMKTVYLFVVSSSDDAPVEARWYVDMKKKGVLGLVKPGEKAPIKPDVTISLSDKDLVGLANGTLNPMKLYEAKRVKVRGDIDKAFKVEKILTHEREKLEALRRNAQGKKRERKEVWGERKAVDQLAGSAPGAGGAVKAKL